MALYPSYSLSNFANSVYNVVDPNDTPEVQAAAKEQISNRATMSHNDQKAARELDKQILDEVRNSQVDGYTGSTRNIDFNPWTMTRDEAPVEVPTPDSTQDPGGNIASGIANRAIGMGMVKPPEMPSMKEVVMQQMDNEGKKVVFDQTKIPEWYNSNAFNTGLISFGLNLLSGNDLADSFAQAGNAFEKSFGQEKRTAWAEDLAAQGYDAHEIEAWIQSGDPKTLSDPMDKKMRMQQYNLGQYQLAKAQYENSPEYLQYQRDRESWKDNMQVAEFNANQNYRAASLADQQARLKMAQEEHKFKMAGGAEKKDKVSARDAMLAVQQLSVDLDVANQPVPIAGSALSTAARKVLGDEFGADAIHAMGSEGMKEATRIRNAQNQFVDNAVRLATGAVVRDPEQVSYRGFLFPQGDEFNKPEIVARKRVTQDLFNQVARNISMGNASALDPSVAMRMAREVSSGQATVYKDQSGMIRGVKFKDGNVYSLY